MKARLGVVAAALLFVAPALSSALDVDFFVSTYETTVGGEVEMRFTVYGANPGVTDVVVGETPANLAPSSSRKERRRVDDPASPDAGEATVITRTWIAVSSGSVVLGPFEVRSGDQSVTVPPVHLAIAEPAKSGKTELRWKLADAQARAGESFRITLEAALYGTVDAVYCDAPENAILEAVRLSAQGDGGTGTESEPESSDARRWAAIASWNWIPLFAGTLDLPVAVLEYTTPAGESRKAASPIQSVRVVAGTGAMADALSPRSLGKAFMPLSGGIGSRDDSSPAAKGSVPLPQAIDKLPDAAFAAAMRERWQAGDFVGVLAALRHAEHSLLFPARYRAARLECERALSRKSSMDVPPAAWKQIAVIASAALLSLALILRLFSLRARRFAVFAALSAALSLASAAFAVNVYLADRHHAGIAAARTLFHVPETDSSVVGRLATGTPVTVLKTSGEWLYVQTPESLRGWIPANGVILYTGPEKP